MGKATKFVVGTVVGTAVGLAISYLFGPAESTSFDSSYRSRLDKALDEGEKAANEREAELRRQFEESKRRYTPGGAGHNLSTQ